MQLHRRRTRTSFVVPMRHFRSSGFAPRANLSEHHVPMSTSAAPTIAPPDAPHPAESELFLSAPIPILIEDWSRVYRAVKELKMAGVSDIDRYFDEHPQAVARLRALHAFVAANDAVVQLFDAESKEHFLQHAEILLPADRLSNSAVLRAIYENRTACQGERTLVTFKGRRVPIVWRCSLPKHEDGYRRLHFYAFDVTEQKENSDRLAVLRAEAARAARVSLFAEMSASILHEVSQPLSAVGSSAEAALRWLERDEPDVAEAAAAITQAARWARDATEICRKIRGFIGKAPAKCIDFAAADAVHAALFLIAPEAAARNVRVDSNIDADARLFADPVQVQQVLANLMMNGIQAIESGPSHARTLTVSARLSDAEVVFDVCDTGPGIEQQSIDRLFDPFFTSKSDGMGMGLTVARSIVDAHHGRIWARGEPGAGCCFSFALPAHPRTTDPAA
ncbi:TPA: ATP-binding protein [Burkholderia cenocepacia]|uniref:PAS domain-containing sensor histidine kinase n=1 Tax=Burkholderia cenocepacia TaxID=95486 RepID=UPI001903B570|nr:sensor histidine kinase [Burkholderia cenocepacia]MBJ9915668.1 sensor histidine kinase [Burkholderia cenocepacia]